MKNRFFISIIVLLLLQGCIPKSSVLHLYNININQEFKAATTQPITVKVAYPTALNGVGGSRIYYNDNGRVGYYLYNRWSSSFNKLLFTNIFNTLEKSRKYRYIVAYNSTAKADRVLEISILSFYHLIENEQSIAVARFKVTLIDTNSGRVLKSKIFEYKTAVLEKNAQAFVEGAKRNILLFMQDLIRF